ncbi:Protein kinase [Boothiomyces sp. JEL0838]|nr:Protein kinase [Boothiomyces sp. JEL0838]
MNKRKLQEIEMNKKKKQDNIEKAMKRKATQKIYQKALDQMLQDPVLEGDGLDLSEFISKIKVEEKKEPVPIPQLEYLSNFQKEALLLMRFNHPNIIKIFKVIESPENVYIVMAYAYGGDLGGHISKNTYLTEIEGRRLFRQIVSAMNFIHESKVIHRDLKLENILLDEQNNILISDFGLGKTFSGDDSMNTFCGTPSYAAPEIIQGDVYHGAKADIWAMGVILYAMIAGELPFSAESVKLLYKKIKQVKYTTPSHFSAELVDLINLIFTADPVNRITIDGIRRGKWVNLDCSTLPEKIQPPITTVESLGRAISSVTRENDITVYSINAHNQLQKGVETFEDRQRRSSKNHNIINLKRKKSITIQPSTDRLYSPPSTSPSIDELSSSSISFQVTSPSYSTISSSPTPNEKTNSEVSSLHPEMAQITRSHTINHFGFTRKPSLTPRRESSGDIFVRRKSTSFTPFLHHAQDKLRELSVIDRMSKVFVEDTTKLNYEEINEWHRIHKPPKLIRTMKISCRKGFSSTLEPPVMFQDLHRALVDLQQSYRLVVKKVPEFYIFNLSNDKTEVEIELCKIWLLKLHALKITVKSGNADEFIKELANKLQWTN